ncbi:MAG: hypothetical protein ACPG5B_16750 [Chitinophagales bacterium]
MFLLFSVHTNLLAQSQQKLYENAIDNINCATTKILLIGFDRPVAARNIKNCKYNDILAELNDVQENQTKGYKQSFIDLANAINAYKTKLRGKQKYVAYENALDQVGSLALKNFEQVCKNFQMPDNNICEKLDQKQIKLQTDIQNIVEQNLKAISQYAENGGAEETTPEPANTSTPEPTNDVPVTNYSDNETTTKNNENDMLPIFLMLILSLVVAAILWLYRQQMVLKEKVEDLEMLFKVLHEKKQS